MPYGYSQDLRSRVLDFYDRGNTRQEVYSSFNISRKTLYNWLKRRDETGECIIKERPNIRGHRIISKEQLCKHIAEHPDQFLDEIGEAFKVTGQAIFYACRKFGITRKKNNPISGAIRGKKTSIPRGDKQDICR